MQKNIRDALKTAPGVRLTIDHDSGQLIQNGSEPNAKEVPVFVWQPGEAAPVQNPGSADWIKPLSETVTETAAMTPEQIEQEARRTLALAALERARFIRYAGYWLFSVTVGVIGYGGVLVIRGVGKFTHFISEAFAVVISYAIYAAGAGVGIFTLVYIVRTWLRTLRQDKQVGQTTGQNTGINGRTAGQVNNGQVNVHFHNGGHGNSGQDIANNL